MLLEFALRRVGDEPMTFLLARRQSGPGGAPLGLDRAAEGAVRFVHVGPLTMGALHQPERGVRGRARCLPRLRSRRVVDAGEGVRDEDEITLFDSTGLAIQDLAVAKAAYGKAGDDLQRMDL
jgi:hypothetical protein